MYVCILWCNYIINSISQPLEFSFLFGCEAISTSAFVLSYVCPFARYDKIWSYFLILLISFYIAIKLLYKILQTTSITEGFLLLFFIFVASLSVIQPLTHSLTYSQTLSSGSHVSRIMYLGPLVFISRGSYFQFKVICRNVCVYVYVYIYICMYTYTISDTLRRNEIRRV